MTVEYSATVICDECGTSQEFDMSGIISARSELISLLESHGWDCYAEEICESCASRFDLIVDAEMVCRDDELEESP